MEAVMNEWEGRTRKPVTEEGLERAVAALVDIVERHGSVFIPLLSSLERDLIEFRRRHQLAHRQIDEAQKSIA
jgi:hypothetical protein